MTDILVIDLNERFADCWACGAATPCHWGLPVDECADLAPNDYAGEWGGVPACESCYEAHDQGLLTAANQHAWRRRAEVERRAAQALFARD